MLKTKKIEVNQGSLNEDSLLDTIALTPVIGYVPVTDDGLPVNLSFKNLEKVTGTNRGGTGLENIFIKPEEPRLSMFPHSLRVNQVVIPLDAQNKPIMATDKNMSAFKIGESAGKKIPAPASPGETKDRDGQVVKPGFRLVPKVVSVMADKEGNRYKIDKDGNVVKVGIVKDSSVTEPNPVGDKEGLSIWPKDENKGGIVKDLLKGSAYVMSLISSLVYSEAFISVGEDDRLIDLPVIETWQSETIAPDSTVGTASPVSPDSTVRNEDVI